MSAWTGPCKRTHVVKLSCESENNTQNYFRSLSNHGTLRMRLGFTRHTWPTRISRLWNLETVGDDCKGMSRRMSQWSHKSCMSNWLCPNFLYSYFNNNPWAQCPQCPQSPLGRMPLKKNLSSASLHVDFISMVWIYRTPGPRIPEVSTGETRLTSGIQGGLSVAWQWHLEWPPKKVIQF